MPDPRCLMREGSATNRCDVLQTWPRRALDRPHAIGEGHAVSASPHRPSDRSRSHRDSCTEAVGARAPFQSVLQKLLALWRRCCKASALLAISPTPCGKRTGLMNRCVPHKLPQLERSAQWPRQAARPRKHARAPESSCHILMWTCREACAAACAWTACCCSSLRSTRPRRSRRLLPIALEQETPHGASWALQKRRYSPRPRGSWCCSGAWWRPWPSWSAA